MKMPFLGILMGRNVKTSKGSELGTRIGRNIRTARLRLGLKQSNLAEALGVEDATFSRIETGAQLPSLERLDEIAKILQVSIAALVRDVGEADAFSELLLEAITDLPPREKEYVYALALQYAQHWRAGKAGA